MRPPQHLGRAELGPHVLQGTVDVFVHPDVHVHSIELASAGRCSLSPGGARQVAKDLRALAVLLEQGADCADAAADADRAAAGAS